MYLGIFTKEKDKYVEKERALFRTSEDFPKELMDQRRMQNLEAGLSAMKNKAFWENSYFATVGVDLEKLEQIDPIIEDFLKRLAYFIHKPGSEHVFEINLNIFPWTKK